MIVTLIFGFILFVALILVYIVALEQRRLLREIRKLAALYPPYPVENDEQGEKPGATSVTIEPLWNDDGVGRD